MRLRRMLFLLLRTARVSVYLPGACLTGPARTYATGYSQALPPETRSMLFGPDPKNIRAILAFIRPYKNVIDYELLPYMRFGESKYGFLGRVYEIRN
jgi:hypothetical protein